MCVVDSISDRDRDRALAGMHTLGQRAAGLGLALRAKPPEPTICCGRGCNGCVWESYYAAVRFWLEEAAVLLQTAR